MLNVAIVNDERRVSVVRKMTKSGAVTIPVAVRKELGLNPNDKFTLEVDKETGCIVLNRIAGKCIITGDTKNLVEANGRYISIRALEEIQNNLLGTSLIDELIIDHTGSDLFEQESVSKEREMKKIKLKLEMENRDLAEMKGEVNVKFVGESVGEELTTKDKYEPRDKYVRQEYGEDSPNKDDMWSEEYLNPTKDPLRTDTNAKVKSSKKSEPTRKGRKRGIKKDNKEDTTQLELFDEVAMTQDDEHNNYNPTQPRGGRRTSR